jgi:hypothetical protein
MENATKTTVISVNPDVHMLLDPIRPRKQETKFEATSILLNREFVEPLGENRHKRRLLRSW